MVSCWKWESQICIFKVFGRKGRGDKVRISKKNEHIFQIGDRFLTESRNDEADSDDEERNRGRSGGLGGREVVALADDAVGRVRLGDEELALGASQFVLGAAGVDSKLQIKIQ